MTNYKARRLIVADNAYADHAEGFGGKHNQIDLTGIVHANSQFGMYAIVQEQCNLGCWHNVTRYELAPWGND